MLVFNDENYSGEHLNKNSIPLLVLTVLKNKTDEKHALNASEISEIIENTYGVKADRRTVYSAFKTLNSLGYDISDYDKKANGYYIRDRQFEPEEINLLLGAVAGFPFISEKQTKDLMSKIQSDLSTNTRTGVGNLMIIRPENKSINKMFFTNISLICEAIEKKKKISFTYLDYCTDLKLHPRRDKHYTVNPYGMLYSNGKYYLASTNAYQNTACLYRMDMITDIEIRDYVLDKPLSLTSLRNELADMVYAHPGKTLSFTLRSEKKYLRDIVDEFGTGIIVYDEGEYIRATVHGTEIGMKYWCMQYLEHIEVINPPEFREEIINTLKNNLYIKEDKQ